jgi:FlaA1/EpsC-like NDP-sugar epimerase
MGKPVKILTLAETMIHLMSKTIRSEEKPDGDIAIEFSGLRPGEKLYEELLIGDNCIGTEHPMITRATESKMNPDKMRELLSKLELACSQMEHGVILDILKAAVPEYQPQQAAEQNSKPLNIVKLEVKPNK